MACAARIDDRNESRTKGAKVVEGGRCPAVDTNCDDRNGGLWLRLWLRVPRIRFMVVRGDGHSARGHVLVVLHAQLGPCESADRGPCRTRVKECETHGETE